MNEFNILHFSKPTFMNYVFFAFKSMTWYIEKSIELTLITKV